MKIGFRELVAIVAAMSLMAIVVYAAPSPGSSDVQIGSTVFRNNTADAADPAYAQGGNITQYNISQKIQTQNWATFWGSVRGNWVLEAGTITDNQTNHKIYNWTGLDDSLSGYIFFANQSNVNWNNLQAVNALGVNAEDNRLGLTGKDNVSQTYVGTVTHPELVIGGQTIAADGSFAVQTMSSGGTPWTGVIIESNAGARGRVYTAIVDNGNENYAGVAADYQIIVPVDSTTNLRTYYVYASLS